MLLDRAETHEGIAVNDMFIEELDQPEQASLVEKLCIRTGLLEDCYRGGIFALSRAEPVLTEHSLATED